MLFPKPMGFKFYRDSIRFIGVLAGIAGLGFCVSAIQFIKLGVSESPVEISTHNLTGGTRSNGKPLSYALLT
jgi:cation-transporting P-type ATPase 13A2